MIPNSIDGYRLLHYGARALARVEGAGIRVDTEYLKGAIEAANTKIKSLSLEMKKSDLARDWVKKYGSAANFNSRVQLGEVLALQFGAGLEKTESGRVKTDEAALSAINHPSIKTYLDLVKWKKAESTYLVGISREVVGGFIHPFFNLHSVSTYRSSCDSPNFQNIPVRDPDIGKMIRRMFVPRPGCRLLEADYGGIEVRISACYHKDPMMLSYIRDPSKDMHRDMAGQCFCLAAGDVTKELRYVGKNQFVFPQFYGDWYGRCAPNMWASVATLKTGAGVPVYEHLRKQAGIKSLGDESCGRGTFMAHVRDVQEDFWGNRFKIYARWKKSWISQYQRTGQLELLSGFVCRGLTKKNEIINYPVQGSAFHCLLWSLIRIVLHELKKRKMKALVCGQIHDSIFADVPEKELATFKDLITEVMTVQLPKVWKWIIVPLEVEMATYSKSWAEKD